MIKRIITEKILAELGGEKMIIIKGGRHVGKTELILHLEKVLKDRGDTTIFINAEQRRHESMLRYPKLFVRWLREQYSLQESKKVFLFIDDVHFIKDPAEFLKEIDLATGKAVQIIGTASVTSALVSLSTTPEGYEKKIVFSLRHLSLREYLQALSDFSYTEHLPIGDSGAQQEFYDKHKEDLKEHFKDFVYWGGYPDVAEEPNPTKKYSILGDVIHRYIEKDISSFLRLENVDAYIQLMEILAHESGNLLNHHELSTRLNIHKKTLGKYLDVISNTFTFEFVPPFFTNQKKELAKMRKVYAHDAGIVSYFHHQTVREPLSFFPNISRLKNFLYTEFRKMNYNEKLFFYRTIAKAEIDFVINNGE